LQWNPIDELTTSVLHRTRQLPRTQARRAGIREPRTAVLGVSKTNDRVPEGRHTAATSNHLSPRPAPSSLHQTARACAPESRRTVCLGVIGWPGAAPTLASRETSTPAPAGIAPSKAFASDE